MGGMMDCEGDGFCELEAATCVPCMMALSEIELRAFGRFLEENKDAMRSYGLPTTTVDSIVDVFTA